MKKASIEDIRRVQAQQASLRAQQQKGRQLAAMHSVRKASFK